MKGRSFLLCSAFVSKPRLFASSGLEWTGETSLSVVLHITDIILMRPPSEARLGLEAVDVVSFQGCWGSAALALHVLIDVKGSAFFQQGTDVDATNGLIKSLVYSL